VEILEDWDGERHSDLGDSGIAITAGYREFGVTSLNQPHIDGVGSLGDGEENIILKKNQMLFDHHKRLESPAINLAVSQRQTSQARPASSLPRTAPRRNNKQDDSGPPKCY